MLNSININNSQSKPIAFTSLKSNLRLGEKVLKEFNSEYPYLRSNSFVGAKIRQNKNNPKFDLINLDLYDLSRSYCHRLGEVRKAAGYLPPPYTYGEFIEHLKKLSPVLSEIRAGNCSEQAKMIQAKILENKELAHNVLMHVQKSVLGIFKYNKWHGDHTFTIIGLKDGAKINKPKTWGNEAVIVDAWTNTVMPAREAIQYFENFLGFGSQKVSSKFKLLDKIKAEDLVN